MSNKITLAQAKKYAESINLTFPANITLIKLQEMIKEEGIPEVDDTKIVEEVIKIDPKDDPMRLIRIRVSSNAPEDAKKQGNFIKVGNSVSPTFTKFILFNSEDGYHVPFFVLGTLEECQYRAEKTIRGKDGKPDRKEHYLTKRYNIQILPQLTEQELGDLATKQLKQT